MLKLNENKLASLRRFDDVLSEKYGSEKSVERKEFDAKAKAWYYAEVLHKAIPLIIIILQSHIASFRITFRSQIRSFSVTVILGHFHFRGRKSPL